MCVVSEKETSSRNFGDMNEMIDRYPEQFTGPDGKIVPILTMEMDGGKGAGQLLTRFNGGLTWYIHDLCALHENENEGTSNARALCPDFSFLKSTIDLQVCFCPEPVLAI